MDPEYLHSEKKNSNTKLIKTKIPQKGKKKKTTIGFEKIPKNKYVHDNPRKKNTKDKIRNLKKKKKCFSKITLQMGVV